MRRPVKIGVGGPVGSGKTALLDGLCKAMRDRRRVLAAPLVALALASCATEANRLDAAKVVTGVEIAPYAIYQECIELQPGERIGYRFNVRVNRDILFDAPYTPVSVNR